jgi:hypothetical protein
VLQIRLMRTTLKGISHREVLNAASHEANGIKTLQRTRDSCGLLMADQPSCKKRLCAVWRFFAAKVGSLDDP